MARTISAHRVERVDYLTLCDFSNQKKERLMVPGTKKVMALYAYKHGSIRYFLIHGWYQTKAENLLWQVLLDRVSLPSDDLYYEMEPDVPTEFESSVA